MGLWHEVLDGDGFSSIAETYGFFVETLWNHPLNAELKQSRKHPNTLLPGDRVYVPEKTSRSASADTCKRHVFKLRGVPATFRLQLLRYGKPRVNCGWQLTIDGETFEGVTDARGFLEVHVSPLARKGILTINSIACEVNFTGLRPADQIDGVQQRLRNLGYYSRNETAGVEPTYSEALRGFQRRVALPETGVADDETIRRLNALHDTPEVYRPH